MADLVLASTSPRRRELLARLGLPFTVRPASVDEEGLEVAFKGAAVHLALHLARHKAAAGRVADPAATVIAADTTVLLGGDVLGKPRDAAEAWATLRRLRGREHQVRTGLVVHAPDRAEPLARAVTTHVMMREYSDDEIARYIASGDPFDKAGSYAIQHPDFQPVAAIRGCAPNVMGLPLSTLAAMLRALGYAPATPAPGPNGCPWDDRCSRGAYGRAQRAAIRLMPVRRG